MTPVFLIVYSSELTSETRLLDYRLGFVYFHAAFTAGLLFWASSFPVMKYNKNTRCIIITFTAKRNICTLMYYFTLVKIEVTSS